MCKGVDWDEVTVSNIWWWALVKMVMIPRLLQNGQKLDRLLTRVILS